MPSLGLFEASKDVGSTPKPGKASFDASFGEYEITGGGENIWGNEDAFHFVYRRIQGGDFRITADIRLVGQGVNAHRKAAVMFRQTLDADSPYADVAAHGDGLTSLQYRREKQGVTAEIKSVLRGPRRIRLERRGNLFVMSAGDPGDLLITAEPVQIELPGPGYLGLAVCSHDANVLETAVFTNVAIG